MIYEYDYHGTAQRTTQWLAGLQVSGANHLRCCSRFSSSSSPCALGLAVPDCIAPICLRHLLSAHMAVAWRFAVQQPRTQPHAHTHAVGWYTHALWTRIVIGVGVADVRCGTRSAHLLGGVGHGFRGLA